jgi:hypothetical protein
MKTHVLFAFALLLLAVNVGISQEPEQTPEKMPVVSTIPEPGSKPTIQESGREPSLKTSPSSGWKILILKPVMHFEDVQSDLMVPQNASMESEYSVQLANASIKGIGTRFPLVDMGNLESSRTETVEKLRELASRMARGNINEEAKEQLARLSEMDEGYMILVQYFRLKTGPGGSWNPNTGAITSSVASTLLQAALVSCKSGEVLWKSEQFVRKALKPTSNEFHKLLDLLYKDYNHK